MPNTRSRLKNHLPRLAALGLALTLGCAHASGGPSPQAAVTELMQKDLPDFAGKEVVMITVDFPPGAVDPVHRHDAHAFVYVLEGSIVMGVRGGKEVTLTPGQTFYEAPSDIHTVGRNASATKPAKFLVLAIKAKGAPIVLPAE